MPVDHYENFPVASLLLPSALREPVSTIYRFARTADDFADEGNDPPEMRLAKLGRFQALLLELKAGNVPDDPLFKEIGNIQRLHGLPAGLFQDLLSAFSQDVTKSRYADFSEVLDYCRRSANPIGRLLLHLFGKNTPENLKHADCICSALQLINFWQDVAIDFTTKNRIYLPQDDMARFGVGESHLAEGRCDPAFQSLLRFQVERARALMLEGKPLLEALSGRIRLEIALTMQGGLRILEKLERAGYDMFRHRPMLKAVDWPLLFFRAL